MKNALRAVAAILFAASLTGCFATIDGPRRHDERRNDRHHDNGEHRGDRERHGD